ncbi:MAG: hypothetical protein M9894_24825 [Planctomycetes bacterium]|nr:hypothetical protein [Planctomycetota bacterium]
MPWEHCGQSVADDIGCPTCGLTKAQWSVKFDATRTFRLSRRPAAMLNVELVDVDGEPVHHEGLRAVLPDGQEVVTATDLAGRAVVSCAAGQYTVEFPKVDPPQLVAPDAAEPDPAGGFRCPTGRKQRFELTGTFLDYDVEAEGEWMDVVGVPYVVRAPDGAREGVLDETRRVRVLCPPAWVDERSVELELFLDGAGPGAEFEVQAEDGCVEVVGLPYTLTLPDGSAREGVLDATRRVRAPVAGPVRLELHLDRR